MILERQITIKIEIDDRDPKFCNDNCYFMNPGIQRSCDLPQILTGRYKKLYSGDKGTERCDVCLKEFPKITVCKHKYIDREKYASCWLPFKIFKCSDCVNELELYGEGGCDKKFKKVPPKLIKSCGRPEGRFCHECKASAFQCGNFKKWKTIPKWNPKEEKPCKEKV